MKAHHIASIAAALAIAPAAFAANVAAGKAKVEQVCAACHGPEGISVADNIPNLGGQRRQYIEAQLTALKSGARQNSMMNNIAAQLSRDDIANIAAYFSSLPGAGSATTSDFMPSITRTNVPFPANHRQTFVKYFAANFPDLKQVRHYYANPVAIEAARAGRKLPDGAILLAEVSTVKLDDKLDLARVRTGSSFPTRSCSIR